MLDVNTAATSGGAVILFSRIKHLTLLNCLSAGQYYYDCHSFVFKALQYPLIKGLVSPDCSMQLGCLTGNVLKVNLDYSSEHFIRTNHFDTFYIPSKQVGLACFISVLIP